MVAVRDNGEAVVVEVHGEFAEKSLDEFNGVMASLLQNGRVQIVINLKRAQWASLKALKWLVEHVHRARDRNGDMKLAGLNPHLSNMLELTGTHSLFDVYGNVEDAVNSFRLVSTPTR